MIFWIYEFSNLKMKFWVFIMRRKIETFGVQLNVYVIWVTDLMRRMFNLSSFLRHHFYAVTWLRTESDKWSDNWIFRRRVLKWVKFMARESSNLLPACPIWHPFVSFSCSGSNLRPRTEVIRYLSTRETKQNTYQSFRNSKIEKAI